ncbi:MAG: FAD:protein FMN transferase [Muribaculaceae bacterium]|nr:FAD:protein FMN transferase [Muribaculaceae bacterium]
MRTIFTALISVIILSFASCTRNNFREFSGLTWGTTYHIVYNSPVDLNDSILAELERVDNSLSMFNPLSTLSAINSSLTTRPDKYVADVIKISQKANKLSDGAFDPTVEPLVNLWGFGSTDRELGSTPSDSAIARALRRVGITDCYITSDGILIKKHPLTRFDFSGVAKGYGVNRVARMLERNGCADFKVEIGGEVVLQGLNPSGKPWRIKIEAPNPDPSISEELCIKAFGPEVTSIASSGNYRNFRTDSLGNRYGHTISPRTGRPIQSDVLSATVILPGSYCGLADALATAAMVLPSDSASAMLRSAGAAAILVIGVGPSERRTIEVNPDSPLFAQK